MINAIFAAIVLGCIAIGALLRMLLVRTRPAQSKAAGTRNAYAGAKRNKRYGQKR
jgi:hypothetical protein